MPNGGRPSARRARAYVEEALRWLPDAAQRPEPHEGATAPRSDAWAKAVTEATSATSVLVADDNADMREYLRQLLSPHYRVRTVAHGGEALVAARAERPACILTDVMMPVLDGFGLIRAVREDPALESVPVIVLSARAGDEARAEGIDRGADDYLVKPFNARELVARVGAQVQRDRTLHMLRGLFEQAPGFAAVTSGPDHVFTMVNAECVRLLGRRQLPGQAVRAALPEFAEQGYLDILDRVYRTNQPFVGRAMKVSLRESSDAPGTTVYIDFVFQPFEMHDGKIAGIFIQGHDITDQHRLVEQLRDADRRKDDFLAVLAHELRNPLAPIRNAVQLMQVAAPAESHVMARAILGRQLAHLTRLIDDLLDVSRITRGKLELRTEPLELMKVLNDAFDTSRPGLEAKRQHLDVTCPSQPVHLNGDRTRLAQVFANLLNNASKFSGEETRIEVVVGVEAERVSIRVRDVGIGIPAQMLKTVFEPFAQAENTGRMREGLGIGLTLARELLAMHGGTIEAASAGPGEGSEFTVTLPLAAEDVAGESGGADHRRPPATGLRVLIADDNDDFASSLAQILELEGHEARRARDGVQAIELADAFRPDLVLLDIGMPRLDGLGAARTLRTREWAKSAKFVALTGWGQAADRARTREAGFDVHLVKPVELGHLRQLIERHFSGDGPPRATEEPPRGEASEASSGAVSP